MCHWQKSLKWCKQTTERSATPFLLGWELKDRGFPVLPTNCVCISQWLPRLAEHWSHLEDGRASETPAVCFFIFRDSDGADLRHSQCVGVCKRAPGDPNVRCVGNHCPKRILWSPRAFVSFFITWGYWVSTKQGLCPALHILKDTSKHLQVSSSTLSPWKGLWDSRRHQSSRSRGECQACLGLLVQREEGETEYGEEARASQKLLSPSQLRCCKLMFSDRTVWSGAELNKSWVSDV